MKIVLLCRSFRVGDYSIEELFHAIAREMSTNAEVTEYQTGSRWSILRDVWRLRAMRADIYHLTGDINYLVLLLPRKKTVLTIHDIGHYLYGLRGLKRWVYKWLWLILPIRAASIVTAVSKETRKSIVRHLDILGSRIETVENCHSGIFKPAPRPFTYACPVILQIGTKPYKNVPRLIEALRGIKCQLVLIGQLDATLRHKLAECSIDYVSHANLSHEEVYQRYVECDMVSFVSTGEGFGVPIIEAQATGRPIITSKVSPMREVAGDGACLVDPLDISQIREGIQRIISDSDYRDQLVAQGLRNVARYSPPAIAGQYLELYRRLTRA